MRCAICHVSDKNSEAGVGLWQAVMTGRYIALCAEDALPLFRQEVIAVTAPSADTRKAPDWAKTLPERQCTWCETILEPRPSEKKGDFLKRRYCNASCSAWHRSKGRTKRELGGTPL